MFNIKHLCIEYSTPMRKDNIFRYQELCIYMLIVVHLYVNHRASMCWAKIKKIAKYRRHFVKISEMFRWNFRFQLSLKWQIGEKHQSLDFFYLFIIFHNFHQYLGIYFWQFPILFFNSSSHISVLKIGLD